VPDVDLAACGPTILLDLCSYMTVVVSDSGISSAMQKLTLLRARKEGSKEGHELLKGTDMICPTGSAD
jgi:hypothetical protein